MLDFLQISQKERGRTGFYTITSVLLTLMLALLLILSSADPVMAVSETVKELAQKQYHMFEEETGFVDLNQRQQRRLNHIMGRLKPKAERDRSDLNFKIEIVDSKVTNALYIGDGYILIFRGLYNKLKSDSELAGVIAHEMGHGVGNDIQENINFIRGVQIGTILFDVLTENEQVGMSQTEAIAWSLIKKGYSREQERAADKYAVHLLYRTNFDPAGMVNTLKTLKKTSGDKSDSELTQLLMDHPHLENRIDYTSDLVYKLRSADNIYYSPTASGSYFIEHFKQDKWKQCWQSYTEEVKEQGSLSRYRDNKNVKRVHSKITALKSRGPLNYKVELRNRQEGTARVAISVYPRSQRTDNSEVLIALNLKKTQFGWRLSQGPFLY